MAMTGSGILFPEDPQQCLTMRALTANQLESAPYDDEDDNNDMSNSSYMLT